MAQVEKKDSVSINEPAPVASPRLSLSSLTDGIVRSIKYTGEEIKKAGAKLNTIDTTYISPNKYNLAFMLEQSSWYEHYRLVGVALTPSQVQTAFPCRCSTTALISGSCT